MTKKIAIIGGGAWGTALAIKIAANGNDVSLWCRNPELALRINKSRENKSYLSGIKLPKNINAVSDFADISSAEAIFLCIPAQHMREQMSDVRCRVSENVPLVICSKGIEEKSLKLMSEVVREIFQKNPIAILSGPNFASEIAAGLPAAATLACKNKKIGKEIAQILASNVFRIYQSTDIIGAEVGGAVKNVIAIACGIAMGKDYGENARAALITRGLAETTRLAAKLGGKTETLMGLAGIGDLVLTCSSTKSRNMSLGYELGKGGNLVKILKNRGHKVTEGVASSRSVALLAKKLKLEMPISAAVYAILHEGAGIDETIAGLLNRKTREEF